MIVFMGQATENAPAIMDMINACVERRLKVKSVETPKSFPWIDDKGEPFECNNYFDNKAIFTFVPA